MDTANTKIKVLRMVDPENLPDKYEEWLKSFDSTHAPIIHITKQNVIWNGTREILYFTILYSIKTY